MKSIIDISQNKVSMISIEGYIRSWLSLIGNVVGLKVEMDYFL